MNVYTIWPEEDFASVLVPDRGVAIGLVDRLLSSVGRRLPTHAAIWRRVDGLPLPDIAVSRSALLVADPARIVVEPLLGSCAASTVDTPEGGYCRLDVGARLGALDRKASTVFELGGRVAHVSSYVFDEPAIGQSAAFTLTDWPDGSLFVTDAFVEPFLETELRGIAFRRVWPRPGLVAPKGGGLVDRLSDAVNTWTLDAFESLPPEARAWIATRQFEMTVEEDGFEGFVRLNRDLLPLVSAGYRRIGIFDAADAVDEFAASPAVSVMAARDDFDLSDVDWEQIESWSKRVGIRDGERLAFVASNREAFAPFVSTGRLEDELETP